MLQEAANRGSSTQLIFGVLAAIWLLGVVALFVHIARANRSRGRSAVVDLASRERRTTATPHPIRSAGSNAVARSTAPGSDAIAPSTATGVPQPGATVVTTSVVPAATATRPRWDPARNAWVSEHPDFGLLVLNTETNRWRAG